MRVWRSGWIVQYYWTYVQHDGGRPAAPGHPMPFPSSARRFPRRGEYLLLLASVALVAGLIGVAEAWLRLVPRKEPTDVLGPLHQYSEVYGWEPRKGFRSQENGIRTTINDRGYRGPELPAARSTERRLVVIGDSIAFGLDVDDDATFAARLAARHETLRVANLAVQGYDLGQELIKLEREGLPLRPDIVVVALCLSNDFAEVALPVFLYDGRHPKPYFTLDGERIVEHTDQLLLSWLERLKLFLREHSRVYGLLGGLNKEEHPQQTENWQERARRALQDRGRVTGLAAALLGRMAEDCRRAGSALIVAAFPDKKAYSKGSALLHEIASSPPLQAVTIVDMGERFRARSLAFDEIALDGIGHLSERGHLEAADVLDETLAERGLLPESKARS